MGARDRKKREKGGEQDYEYVFEDQIEFIVDQYLAGTQPVSSSQGGWAWVRL